MVSLAIYVLLICILFNLDNASHGHRRYKGWGWIPNIPMTPGHTNVDGIHYDGPNQVTSQCIVTIKNATFNLLPLHLSAKHRGQIKYYKVKDARSEINPDDDYEYAFNVCGPVLAVPPGCGKDDVTIKDSSYCEDNTLYENGTCVPEFVKTVDDDKVFAYQMKIDEDETTTACYHLSDKDGGPGVWSLINEDNPSEGVTVSYLDGDYDVFCGHNRQINISFVCDNDHGAFGIPGEAKSELGYYSVDNVKESEICQYKLEFHTVYGCPAQCPIVGNKLCNGVGLCGYDWTIQQPRCYCYSMFTGDSCTEIDVLSIFEPKHDPVTADTSSPFVKQFDHVLQGPGKKTHHVKVTYDLEEFHTDPSAPYIMRDIDGIQHTYVWNFMGDINFDINISNSSNKTLTDYGCKQIKGYCQDLNGTCSSLTAQEGYIYQINEDLGTCVVAGGRDVMWDLYDSDNPARGVILKYSNGDYCPIQTPDGTTINKNRRFTITLLCPDDSNTYIPLSDETQRIFDAYVEEDDFDLSSDEDDTYTGFCNYHVTITSAFACPDECLTDATNTPDIPNDVSVCSAQGMCASDPFSGYVHCLCDDTWTGDYCDEPYVEPPIPFKYKNQGSYIAAIIIISVILIAICYFGYRKINTQKQKVKELEIKLVNYQSSGGAATFHDERPPQIDDMPQSKGASLSDKIKNKFAGNKRGKYSNLSSHNDDDDDEQQLFNVKVKMNGGRHSENDDDDEEENDDDKEYNKPKQEFQIGDDEEDNSDNDDNNDDDDDDDDDDEEDDK